jgi:hypothetical protein
MRCGQYRFFQISGELAQNLAIGNGLNSWTICFFAQTDHCSNFAPFDVAGHHVVVEGRAFFSCANSRALSESKTIALNQQFDIIRKACPLNFIDRLSPRAKNAFYKALTDPTDWAHVVWLCIEEGTRDADFLADIPFHLHHPELGGRSLGPHEHTLITQWRTWRWIVGKMLPEEKVKTAKDPTLANWLKSVDVTKAPWRKDHTMWSHMNRLEHCEKFRAFMAKASEDEGLYETTYPLFKYQNAIHSGYTAYDRTAYVLSFWKAGKSNALTVLKNEMSRSRGNLQGLSKRFFGVERSLFINVDVVHRWAVSSSTSDGPTNYDNCMKWLVELRRKSKSEFSILSVHADMLDRVYRFKTDPNPHTAGLPF